MGKVPSKKALIRRDSANWPGFKTGFQEVFVFMSTDKRSYQLDYSKKYPPFAMTDILILG